MADIDTTTAVRFTADPAASPCPHLTGLSPVTPSANGCQDCLETGSTWVHLRLCLGCGTPGAATPR